MKSFIHTPLTLVLHNNTPHQSNFGHTPYYVKATKAVSATFRVFKLAVSYYFLTASLYINIDIAKSALITIYLDRKRRYAAKDEIFKPEIDAINWFEELYTDSPLIVATLFPCAFKTVEPLIV